jgi:hypothetical protein
MEPLTMALLGGAAFYAYKKHKAKQDRLASRATVQGKSGMVWRTEWEPGSEKGFRLRFIYPNAPTTGALPEIISFLDTGTRKTLVSSSKDTRFVKLVAAAIGDFGVLPA